MENGHMGIVPGAAQKGDAVCVFRGATAPCLLREDVGGYWKLISGDCFIHDDEYEDVQFGISCDAVLDALGPELDDYKIR